MKLLVDRDTGFENGEQGGNELVVETYSGCQLVGKRSGAREFVVVLNEMNSSLVDIDENFQKLISKVYIQGRGRNRIDKMNDVCGSRGKQTWIVCQKSH